jgi:mRNA-degrading endonuclease RelE of RelBE toxin-antitoxin system
MPQLTKRAQKDLEALPKPLAATAREMCFKLDNQPLLGKKLSGQLEGKRSARLGRSHRIIYALVGGEVVVLTIRARKDVYR